MTSLKLLSFGALALFTCTSSFASFKINEIDSDSPNTPSTDFAEFIELKGNPNESASGLKLVWFNGGAGGVPVTGAYKTIDLTTCSANAQGYLLVGTLSIPGVQIAWAGNTLQNGEDAVALYDSSSGTFATNAPPSATGLIDYIVYQTSQAAGNDGHATNWTLFTGGSDPPVYDENGNGSGANDSLSRIPDGTGTFQAATPTPGSMNIVTKSYTLTNPVSFFRYNQVTALSATTRTVTLTNTGDTTLTVNTFALDPSSSSAFTVLTPPTMSFPGGLGAGKATSMTLQFVDASPTVNKTYGGTINLSTDADSTPTLVVPITAELVRFTHAAAVGSVKINEVCYNPGTIDHNHDGAVTGQFDEFVELYNTTAAPIIIEGWEQNSIDADNTANRNSAIFPAGATIPANGWATLFTNGSPTGFAVASVYTAGTAARIRNAAPGAYESLNDGTKTIDAIAYLTAEDTPDVDGFINTGQTVATAAGGSFGRRPDGASTFRSFDPSDSIVSDRPTPNTTNAATPASDWSLYQ